VARRLLCSGSAIDLLWKEADELTRILVRSRDGPRESRAGAGAPINIHQSPIKNQSSIKDQQSQIATRRYTTTP
jgi:hypothetical protein